MPIYNPAPLGYTPAKYTYGGFTGDAAANRAIPHGIGRIPTLVIVENVGGAEDDFGIYHRDREAKVFKLDGSATAETSMTDTNFYVSGSVNANGLNHKWVAIG